MAFCSKCGAPVAEGEKTCGACGSAVRDFAANAKAAQEAPPVFCEGTPPMVRPKFCTKCGAAVCGEEQVCRSCGAEIKAVPAKFNSVNPDWTAASAENKKRYNVLAVIALPASFLPFILLAQPELCLVASAVVIIMGIVALNQIKNSGKDGKMFAVSGIIIASIAALIGITIFAVLYTVSSALGIAKNTFVNFFAEASGAVKDSFVNFFGEALGTILDNIL